MCCYVVRETVPHLAVWRFDGYLTDIVNGAVFNRTCRSNLQYSENRGILNAMIQVRPKICSQRS